MASEKTPLHERPFDDLRREIADDIKLLRELLLRIRLTADPEAEISIEQAVVVYQDLQRAMLRDDDMPDRWKLHKLTLQAIDSLRVEATKK